ncbi:hypothetical protein [Cupriavidus oxalaticus]|uniref:hypothetical protein n=1 Tax=Cupriavidus oxalaticus TaxID=96344 RepID=UPI0031811820
MTDFFATVTRDDAPQQGLDLQGDGHAATGTPSRARAFPTANLNVLALDLGTTTGWAVATRDGRQKSGSLRLDPKKLGGNGRRWIAFREFLTATAREAGGVQAVYYERVCSHTGTTAAHVYGGYLAMLEAWCAANNIPMHGVAVATAKKAWTGNGRAKKPDMIAEAERRGVKVIDDNHADALAVLAYGVKQEA